jgi:uncharacterized protein YciI
MVVGPRGSPVVGGSASGVEAYISLHPSLQEIKAFVEADPYVKNGLVPSWTIKPYAVVVP